MNPTTGTNSALANAASIDINNSKAIRITKLDGGFLLEKQNVKTYGSTNDVAVDLEAALAAATSYFNN